MHFTVFPYGFGLTLLNALASVSRLAIQRHHKNNMSETVGFLRSALPIFLVFALTACASGPPVQEMSDARQAIAAVTLSGENERAESLLAQARALLASAEAKLRRQAYNGAKVDAVEARRKALEALEELDQAGDKN